MRIYKVHYVLAIKFGVSSRTNIIDVLAVRQWYIKKETIVTQDSWCSSLSEFPQAISSPNFLTQATRWTLHAPTRISIIKQITQNYKLSIQTSQLRVASRESSNLITFVKSLITEDYMHNLNIQITNAMLSTNYTVKPCLVRWSGIVIVSVIQAAIKLKWVSLSEWHK